MKRILKEFVLAIGIAAIISLAVTFLWFTALYVAFCGYTGLWFLRD